ncbi:hypothetical protein [Microcoleus sp. herbarium5]|uniref:hypothetical protein n=1 Tax=Microcoleus sp. herbarium5 TaxID=3055434 RepID=UPI002FCE9593
MKIIRAGCLIIPDSLKFGSCGPDIAWIAIAPILPALRSPRYCLHCDRPELPLHENLVLRNVGSNFNVITYASTPAR